MILFFSLPAAASQHKRDLRVTIQLTDMTTLFPRSINKFATAIPGFKGIELMTLSGKFRHRQMNHPVHGTVQGTVDTLDEAVEANCDCERTMITAHHRAVVEEMQRKRELMVAKMETTKAKMPSSPGENLTLAQIAAQQTAAMAAASGLAGKSEIEDRKKQITALSITVQMYTNDAARAKSDAEEELKKLAELREDAKAVLRADNTQIRQKMSELDSIKVLIEEEQKKLEELRKDARATQIELQNNIIQREDAVSGAEKIKTTMGNFFAELGQAYELCFNRPLLPQENSSDDPTVYKKRRVR